MKRLLLVVAVFSLLFASNVYACVGNNCTFDNEVKSTGEGNQGNIFVYDCTKNGNIDVGTWVDPSSIPELKGEKGNTGETGQTGATGATGSQGIQGEVGATGSTGLNGTNGQNGQDGRDGINGTNGINGSKGDTGSQGEQGQTGINGVDGKNGQDGALGETGKTGDTGKEGSKGEEGKKGSQGIQGIQGKGLEDRVEFIGEVRILDTKRTTWSIYAGHDINNDVNIVGAKLTVKLGRSYEERRLDELEARLNLMQPTVSNNVEVVPTTTGFRIKTNY